MQFVHIGSRSIKTVGNRGDLLPLEPCATTETTLLARAQRSGGRVWVIDNQIGVTGNPLLPPCTFKYPLLLERLVWPPLKYYAHSNIKWGNNVRTITSLKSIISPIKSRNDTPIDIMSCTSVPSSMGGIPRAKHDVLTCPPKITQFSVFWGTPQIQPQLLAPHMHTHLHTCVFGVA